MAIRPPEGRSVPHIDDLLASEAPLWEEARRGARGPRVLLATSMGGFNHGAMTDKALALALTLRGARLTSSCATACPAAT